MGWEFIPADAPHRLLGFDPRAARLAPAGAVEHHQLNGQSVRFFEGVVGGVIPLRRKHFDGAHAAALAMNVAYHRAFDADFRHGFQVLGDAFFGDVTVDPVPVTPGFGFLGGIDKLVFERSGRCG